MTTSRRLAPLPLLASLLRTPRRLTSSRFSPSGKSLPSSPLVLTTSRRFAPLTLLLIALLALGGVLLWSAPTEAQTTTRILVSNVGQGADDSVSTSGNAHAQLFDTAGATHGYTLTSVIVVSEDTQGDDFDVEICEADFSGFPTSRLHGPSAAGELHGREPGVHAPRPFPRGEHRLHRSNQAARLPERHARLDHLRRRGFHRPHGVEHQKQVRCQGQRRLGAQEREQRGHPDHRQWL